jgi:biotin transport system substrate-specific component
VEPNAATLRLAVFPRSTLLTNVALVLAGTALVSVAAQIAYKPSFTPIPITGQTFAVLLVGTSLGALLGTASLSLYLLVGLFLPVYSQQKHGWDIVSGASGGYLVGFIVAAAVVGWLAERPHWDRRFSSAVTVMLTGNVIVYAFGLPWLAHVENTGPRQTLEFGLYPFVIGDLFKLYLAAIVLPAAWLGIKRFRGEPDDD